MNTSQPHRRRWSRPLAIAAVSAFAVTIAVPAAQAASEDVSRVSSGDRIVVELRGDDPYEIFGDDPYEIFGDDPYEIFGDDPYEIFGDDPYEIFGDDPYEIFGDDPYEIFGVSPKGSLR